MPLVAPEGLLGGCQVHGLWGTPRMYHWVAQLRVSYSHCRSQKICQEAQGKAVNSIPENVVITHCPSGLGS